MESYKQDDSVLEQPEIDLNGQEDRYPDALVGSDETETQANHNKLLEYLQARLNRGNTDRSTRQLQRLASIDKLVSTWQKLSQEDSERKAQQESDGSAQAIKVNLPLVTSHLEDMVSFYSGIFSPNTDDFYQLPENPDEKAAGEPLVKKMNQDAKLSKQFTSYCRTLRALLKYNVGGFWVEWVGSDQTDANNNDAAQGVNYAHPIDMYNYMWDPSVANPADIPLKAEWAATIHLENRMYIVQRNVTNFYVGANACWDDDTYSNTGRTSAKYFKYPPNQAGITAEDGKSTQAGNVDWNAYGASLAIDQSAEIDGHERVEMYCRLNPKNFNMRLPGQMTKFDGPDGYYLWRFTILDNKRIVRAQPVNEEETDLVGEMKTEIPHYLGYMLQDDMGQEQKSTAEFLAPFQSYGSFLVNANISGTRGSQFGLIGYDPAMFDLSKIPAGETAARIASKMPGRDVRAGIQRIVGDATPEKNTMAELQALLGIMREFFPAQALPAQIAGIDRAVTSQVAAVMQGVSRRLHMLVRVMDDDIMNPARRQMYRNLIKNQAVNGEGLTDGLVAKLLGSGLQQLNREIAETAMRQLLFAVIQNPQAAQSMDVIGLMDFWSGLLNVNVSMEDFRIQQPAPAAPPTQGPPAVNPGV